MSAPSSRGRSLEMFEADRPDKPDLGELIQAICNKLGIPDKKVVAEITITPTEATVLYYRLDENGQKYVESDGSPATRWFRQRVVT